MAQTQEIRDETGAQRLLGYVIDLSTPDGSALVRMTVGPDSLNRQDILHGGLAALLLDTAMGAAASRSVDASAAQRFSTLSLTVNFLSPGRPGVIEATGRVTGGGRRTRFAEAVLRQTETGAVIATATGVFRMATPPSSPCEGAAP